MSNPLQTQPTEASELFPEERCISAPVILCTEGMLVPEKAPSQINYDDAPHFQNQARSGPMMLIKHFSPFLPRNLPSLSPTQPSLTSYLGYDGRSRGVYCDNRLGRMVFLFDCRRSLLPSLRRRSTTDLSMNSGDKAMSIALHPGTVKTDFSKEFWDSTNTKQLFSPKYAAKG